MAEISKESQTFQQPITRILWYLFLILAIFTFFYGLNIPLVGPDEPRYAQVAREMFERGNWITPTLGGFPWFEKPALLYWVEIISYEIFGVSEFTARLGSALFGLGTVFALWGLGRSLVSHLDPGSDSGRLRANNFAKWLVIVGVTTVGIVVFAHGASFDIILTFPLTASLVCFFIAESSANRSFVSLYLPLIGSYIFIGVAFLAKGLVGMVFPFAIVGFYFVLSRKIPKASIIASFFWGSLISLAVAALWYVPVYLQNGYRFIDEFFIQHHFQRYISNKYQHPQPFYFFLWVLPLMMLPWLPFFLYSLWDFLRDTVSRRKVFGEYTQTEEMWFRSLRLFAFAWLFVPVVFFSFSGSKLPGYVLPSVPPAIILTAALLFKLVDRQPAWRIPLTGLAITTLIALILVIRFLVPGFADSDSVKTMIAAANVEGSSNEKIFSLHTVSHNAEFYAAGRIERTNEGQQRRFNSVQEIVDQMKAEGFSTSLVIMPIAYIKEMPIYNMITAQAIADNGEFAIVRFTLK